MAAASAPTAARMAAMERRRTALECAFNFFDHISYYKQKMKILPLLNSLTHSFNQNIKALNIQNGPISLRV